MQHDERIALANQVAQKILEKYGNRVLYIGLGGSVARNEDKEHSDIDIVVVSNAKKSKKMIYALKDTILSVEFKSLRDVAELTKAVSVVWPLDFGQLNGNATLYDRNFLDKFKKNILSLENKKFVSAAEHLLMEVAESIDKFKTKYNEKNFGDMKAVATDYICYRTNNFVGLLNRGGITRSLSSSVMDVAKFKKIPKDYVKLYLEIFESNKEDKLYKIVLKFWHNCVDFARKNGIVIKKYYSLEEIKL